MEGFVYEEQKIPAYQRIKRYILDKVHQGEWRDQQVIPTEEALAKQFSVSRMTVNRALRELAAEQVLTRVQGSGTFVSQKKYQSTLVKIRAIADEIRERGHQYHCRVLALHEVCAAAHLAAAFEMAVGSRLFRSLIVSYENDEAIQLEERWVNTAVAAEYLLQDFTRTTANAYLTQVAPLQGASYRIEACRADSEVAAHLATAVGEPCLVLRRTTRSRNQVASVVTMWHPGDRYQFVGHY